MLHPAHVARLSASGPWEDAAGRLQDIGRDAIALLPNFVIGLIVFTAFYLGGRAVRTAVRRFSERRRKHRNVALALGRLGMGAAVLLGALVACVVVFPNFTPARLLEFLGLGSVAIGFAFRDVLQNYLAGVLLLLTEPFRIGDQIVFRDFEGTIEDVQTRATTIRTYDGRRILIPNAELFTNPVTVNTAYDVRRLEYDVGIGYGDPIDRAKKIILETLAGVSSVLPEPAPDVLTMELAPSSVVLRVRWWIRPPIKQEALDARDSVLAAIKEALQRSGIDLPFPTTHVLFHDQTEETDGDRARQREGWPADGRAPRPRGVAHTLHQIAAILQDRAARDDAARHDASNR